MTPILFKVQWKMSMRAAWGMPPSAIKGTRSRNSFQLHHHHSIDLCNVRVKRFVSHTFNQLSSGILNHEPTFFFCWNQKPIFLFLHGTHTFPLFKAACWCLSNVSCCCPTALPRGWERNAIPPPLLSPLQQVWLVVKWFLLRGVTKERWRGEESEGFRG